MYEKSRVNVKVEPRSTFTFTSDLPYMVSNLFTHVKPVKVYVRTHVKITRQWNPPLETMYGRSHVNVKVERGSTFTSTRSFSYIVSILFTHVKPVYVRTHVKITRQWKSTLRAHYWPLFLRTCRSQRFDL